MNRLKKEDPKNIFTDSIRNEWLNELAEENEIVSLEKVHISSSKAHAMYLYSLDKKIARVYYDKYCRVKRGLRCSRRRDDTYEWIELDKPQFYGYSKSYQVRSELKNSSDYPILKLICEKTTDSAFCKNKSFIRRNHITKEKEIVRPLHKAISSDKYESLPEKARKNFFKIDHYFSYSNKSYSTYETLMRWRWDEEKITKLFYTHRGIPISTVLREEAEASSFLWNTRKISGRRRNKALNWSSGRFADIKKRGRPSAERRLIATDEMLRQYYHGIEDNSKAS